jgi:serine/threonine protein kinase
VSERQPGTVLDGKYEIQARLGGGGMGEVYLVNHLHLDERRVIKVLRTEDAADPVSQKRFLRAARTATQIKHPNVAILYDYSSLPDGSFYMVWEYVDGEDVGSWLERRGPFPLDLALDLGVQTLRGLEAIHSHGVIHRDVSPDNLMLTRDVRGKLRLKIIDLGLAKSLRPPTTKDAEVTQAGMFMGKLRYCSPEQAGMVEGVVLDRRTDLYSFAAVFYEMLCGMAPFESETPHGFVFKRLTEEPLPLVGRVEGLALPAALDTVIHKALERDREKRYPTAVRFIEALEKVQVVLREVSTREMPRPHATQPHPTQPPQTRPRPLPGPTPGGAPGERSSSQLTREERDELLAQISRASRRVEQTRDLLGHAETALDRGRVDEARRLAAEAEKVDPRAKGLADLKGRIRAEENASAAADRVREAEEMLAGYIEGRQLPLARLALQTLLDLEPQHPHRQEYERRIRTLAEDADKEQRAGKVLAGAREDLTRGDFKAARRKLGAIRRADPSGEMANAFEAELAAAEKAQATSVEVADRRQKFERLVGRGRFEEAAGELDALADLEVTKVTLGLLGRELDDARSAGEQQERGRALEAEFADKVKAGDWLGAQEAALEMEKEMPRHPELANMLAEVERLREEQQRRAAIAQGESQVEAFLAAGKADEAAMALKILVKMQPDHPRRKQLEKKIAAMRK